MKNRERAGSGPEDEKTPPRRVRGKTRRGGEPVGTGGGPHEVLGMTIGEVRALPCGWEPAVT